MIFLTPWYVHVGVEWNQVKWNKIGSEIQILWQFLGGGYQWYYWLISFHWSLYTISIPPKNRGYRKRRNGLNSFRFDWGDDFGRLCEFVEDFLEISLRISENSSQFLLYFSWKNKKSEVFWLFQNKKTRISLNF